MSLPNYRGHSDQPCPLCGHLWATHDVTEMDDPHPTCCTQGCACGLREAMQRRNGKVIA